MKEGGVTIMGRIWRPVCSIAGFDGGDGLAVFGVFFVCVCVCSGQGGFGTSPPCLELISRLGLESSFQGSFPLSQWLNRMLDNCSLPCLDLDPIIWFCLFLISKPWEFEIVVSYCVVLWSLFVLRHISF